MELQFEKSTLDCLGTLSCEQKTVEQTQEVRLPDMMGDIGKVLSCWGQVLLRGKEWRGSSMGVNGGVMVWVLYAPEDGSAPQTVETWVPFSMKWDFPETDRDGYMNVSLLLRCADARTMSARKLMVRVGVSALGQAMVPVQKELASAQGVPEDVQLLRRSYPIKLPREAGEKTFQIEETMSAPAMERILRYEFIPTVADQKVMAGKVVFRGNGQLHVLYMASDETLKSWDTEVPFSQFTDLEREYDDTAEISMTPLVTNLELDQGEDGSLALKAGLTAQYVVYDRSLVEVVEDAYSPSRQVSVKMDELQLPMVLDQRRESLRMEQTTSGMGQVVDVACMAEQPAIHWETDELQLEVAAVFQVLRMEDGTLQSESLRTQNTLQLCVDESSRICADFVLTPWPQAVGSGIHADGQINVSVRAGQGIPMVTGLSLGEVTEPDPNRPSLILRRSRGEQLWELAKESGSTVDAIRKANQLTNEPENGKMLLIPVL